MKRTIAAALAAVSLSAAGGVAAEDNMTQAMQFFESGHYVLARDHLRAAAREGDARADAAPDTPWAAATLSQT